MNRLFTASTRQQVKGFTLLELMIALSIFAVMGLASYRLLSGEARLQTELEQHSQTLQQWQRGMRRLSDDLQQIAPRAIRLEYGDQEAALIGESDRIHFTRFGWSNPLHKTRSQLQRIELQLASTRNDTASEIDTETPFLQRVSWPVLDRAPDSEALSQFLLPDVSDIRWRYMDSDKQWHNQWPLTSQNNTSNNASSNTGSNNANNINELPLAIELTLTSKQFGEIQRLIVLRSFNKEEPNNTNGGQS